jgi:tetratricopeptide (TPR) repeat protein
MFSDEAPLLRGAKLRDGYYLDHFTQVIEGVRGRYGFLLTAAEHEHLTKLTALTTPALMLYARLVNRRGPCFRIARLDYREIDRLDVAVAELLAGGLLQACDGEIEPSALEPVLGCFTQAELSRALRGQTVPRGMRKGELLSWIAAWDGRAGWLARFMASEAVVRIPGNDPWPFLRFLFFGELRDNLSDFVTRALGYVVTESFEAVNLAPHFASRGEAEDAYRMAALYVEFRHVRAASSAQRTLDWWREKAVKRPALLAGQACFDRVIDRLGRLLERQGLAAEALHLYETSPVAPARERRARLLIKSGRRDEALALLQIMRDRPCHAEEAYAARQLLARLERKSRRSEARGVELASVSLLLDYEDGAVEAAVLAHYRGQGWNGLHSENWIWNAAFGLLLWDIIYDPALGVFHSPLQLAPSDLHAPEFYSRRQHAIETRLGMLKDRDAALAIVQGSFNLKRGLANPFVSWNEDLLGIIDVFLRRLPPAGLAEALRHLARDVRRHGSGLPDLFLWTDSDYRFVEVKAENDHLAPHQYHWLQVLTKAGLKVDVQRVLRPPLRKIIGP